MIFWGSAGGMPPADPQKIILTPFFLAAVGGAVDFALVVAFFEGLAFVVLPFADSEAELDFGQASVVEVDGEGDERGAGLGEAEGQSLHFAAVQEQAPVPVGVVVAVGGRGVTVDLKSVNRCGIAG